jgi:hypothetical protein
MLFNQQTSVVFQSLAFVLGAVHARIGLKSFDSDHFSATLDAFGLKKAGLDDRAVGTDASLLSNGTFAARNPLGQKPALVIGGRRRLVEKDPGHG